MDQSTLVADGTGTRRFLRALLLLGGFIVVWWCLATGTAQASDGPHAEGPHRDLGSVTKALGASVDRVVQHSTHQTRRTVEHVTHRAEPVRRTVAKVTQPVRRAGTATTPAGSTADDQAAPHHAPAATPHQAPVHSAVATVVKNLEAAPVTGLVATTSTLLTTLDDTVTATVGPVLEQTRGIVVRVTTGTPLTPVLQALPTATPSPAAGSTTVLSETTTQLASAQHVHQVRADSSPSAGSASVSDEAAADGGPAHLLPSSPIDQAPGHQTPGSLGDAAALMTQSGSGAGGLTGFLANQAGIVPPVAQDLVSTHVDRFPAGPTYRPTCSPD